MRMNVPGIFLRIVSVTVVEELLIYYLLSDINRKIDLKYQKLKNSLFQITSFILLNYYVILF